MYIKYKYDILAHFLCNNKNLRLGSFKQYDFIITFLGAEKSKI